MPAESEDQRQYMGAALRRRREGRPRRGDPKMSTAELRKFAKKKHKGNPLPHSVCGKKLGEYRGKGF